jgi:hypothetical protein
MVLKTKQSEIMNTKSKIMNYLQISSQEYEDRLFHTFWNWCNKYGKNTKHSQQLLANYSVSKWWILEYNKLEDKFLEALFCFPLNRDNLEYHFNGFTIQIYTIYPKALIEAVRVSIQKEEINIINKLPTYYAN